MRTTIYCTWCLPRRNVTHPCCFLFQLFYDLGCLGHVSTVLTAVILAGMLTGPVICRYITNPPQVLERHMVIPRDYWNILVARLKAEGLVWESKDFRSSKMS